MIALAALRTKTVSTTAHHDLRGRNMDEASDYISPAIRDALNWLEYGVLVVNADARVSFLNSRAQELLAAQELAVLGGQLRANTLAQTTLLHELIGRYARRNGEKPHETNGNYHWVGRLMLQFAPVSVGLATHLCEERQVAIFVIDPEAAADPTPQQLQHQFGLTPAEAELAHEIAKGEGLIACAKALQISRATASTHLQRIFEKTGTKRQAQLVRVILGARPAIRRAPSRVVSLTRPHTNA
ncbi:MAG: helix-turn-helix transcriptional regulator [Alphaproteobacteria bacterium]|nr:helix-turn-helix transcriptional regulator [Alphaproteobacteria bacterium]